MTMNKKLALYLLLASAALNQKQTEATVTTDLGPIQISTTDGSMTFASGTVKFYGNIGIGQSSADVITFQGSNITPSTDSNTLITLAIDSSGSLQSSNAEKLSVIGDPTNSYVSVNNVLGDNYNVTLNAGNTGDIILASSGLTLPTDANNYILTINQAGKINSSLKPNIYIGSLEAAQTAGQSILLGDTTAGNNGLALTNNSGNVNLSALVTGANLNLAAANYINIAAGNITNPATGLTSSLGIDENGNLVIISSDSQTFTDLTAAASTTSNETIALGNITSGNYLTFVNNTGNVALTAGIAGSDLLLNADNNIVISSSLVQPTITSQYIGIDANGNLTTLPTPSPSGDITVNSVTTNDLTSSGNNTLGSLTGNFLTLDGSSGNVSIGSTIGNVSLSSTSGSVTLTSANVPLNDITDPYVGVIGVDSSNNIVSTYSTAGRHILGNNTAGKNFIIVDNDTPSNGILISSIGDINLLSSEINTNPGSHFSTLAVSSSGNMVSSDLANGAFMTGTSGTASVLVDTNSGNPTYGVTLDGNLYVTDPSLIPAAGYTNVLTVNSSGQIGIQVSTATKKTNIKKASSEISWDELDAHQYNYIGSQKPEFGYIAEELAQTKDWNKFVVYDQENHPMSVNYNGIFVAAMHIAKNKIEKAEAKIALLEKEIANKNTALESMADKFAELDAQYKILAEQIAQLKLYQQANQQR